MKSWGFDFISVPKKDRMAVARDLLVSNTWTDLYDFGAKIRAGLLLSWALKAEAQNEPTSLSCKTNPNELCIGDLVL